MGKALVTVAITPGSTCIYLGTFTPVVCTPHFKGAAKWRHTSCERHGGLLLNLIYDTVTTPHFCCHLLQLFFPHTIPKYRQKRDKSWHGALMEGR